MATRRTPPQRPERLYQTAEQKKRCIDKINARIVDLTAFDPTTIQQEHTDPQVQALEVSIETALASAFGQNTIEYDRYSRAAYLDRAPMYMHTTSGFFSARGGYTDNYQNNFREAVQAIGKAKAESLALLNQAVKMLEEEIDDMQLMPAMTSNAEKAAPHLPSRPYSIHVNGENSRVNINSHDQSINTVNIPASDYEPLARELRQLREALTVQAKSAQDHITIGAVAAAELAAEEKDASRISRALSSLGTAGHWALKVAKDLGIDVASKVIAAHLI